MGRDSGLTLDGALKILNAHDPESVGRLDHLLGGVILAAGVATAAGAGTVGAPVVAIASIWGWVDQKNEAIGLVRSAVGAVQRRLSSSATLSRRDAVNAAHTVIVGAAYFEALRRHVGDELHASLEFEGEEQLALLRTASPLADATGQALYQSRVPIPSPVRSFAQTCELLETWYRRLNIKTNDFLDGLAAWPSGRKLPDRVITDAIAIYQSSFLEIAAAVPEFQIWSALSEHSATQEQIQDLSAGVNERLHALGDDLTSMREILEATAGDRQSVAGPREVIARANSARMGRPIIRDDEAASLGSIRLPSVEASYVEPNFRVVEVDSESRVGSEEWWQGAASSRTDLDKWLAGFVLTTASTELPLLILGHPGAGKSMVMKVLAARLPAAEYTTVLVPLRDVGANAPIVDQVQQALDSSTNRRVEWNELADQSSASLRVVIFDGLDELLQASMQDRTGYLQAIADFQRVESEQDRPVIAIVTSRTIVADRVDIPSRSVVLKLEGFAEEQIVQWVSVWNSFNGAAIAAGEVRELTMEGVMSQLHLAAQPLLLLLLALYSADPATSPLERNLSTTFLYRNLIEEFARREATKGLPDGRACRPEELRAVVDRLGIAALAMFNRGQQSVTEEELTADLLALLSTDEPMNDTPPVSGSRVVGEFFFVHTPEATTLGAGESSIAPRRSNRSYEFLHATFGEFLVAKMLLDELLDLADQTFGSSRYREPNAARLSGLMCHQALASRPNVLEFLAELFEDAAVEKQIHIRTLLSQLAARVRQWTPIRTSQYRPTAFDSLRRLSTYSANLVLLRTELEMGGTLPLHDLVGADTGDTDARWAELVGLWRCGLDTDGWQGMLSRLAVRNGLAFADSPVMPASNLTESYLAALLASDSENAARQQFGLALHNATIVSDKPDPVGSFLARVYMHTVGIHGLGAAALLPQRALVQALADDGDMRDEVVGAVERLLLTRQAAAELTSEFIGVLSDLGALTEVNSLVLFVNICRFPGLLRKHPELADPELYRDPAVAVILSHALAPSDKGDLEFEDGAIESDDETDEIQRLLNRHALSPTEVLSVLIEELRVRAGEELVDVEFTPDLDILLERLLIAIRDDRWSTRNEVFEVALQAGGREARRMAMTRVRQTALRRERGSTGDDVDEW